MLKNSQATYGAVSKVLHWSTVLLILTLIPLGIYANGLPFDTGEALAHKATLFSLHKTLGVTVFFLALARILWALSQPKPKPLHGGIQNFLAQTVHWLLYGALVLVPLSGWIHHAATTGFAPIWWPFGQSLPLVAKDDGLAHTFAALHIIFERVLVVSLLLHVAGALKHHLIDRDDTLRRMLPGTAQPDALVDHRKTVLPLLGALGVYACALGIGLGLGLFSHQDGRPATPQLAAVETGWAVEDGTLGLTVRQLGSDVTGEFADWTAAINFSQTPDAAGKFGDVEVTVAIPSLSLGSVTAQALGADFLNAAAFATATYTADIFADGEIFIAKGTLRIKELEAPVFMPFTLQIEGDTAVMQGQSKVQRLDFGVGRTYPDETSLGFEVVIEVALTATRAP